LQIQLEAQKNILAQSEEKFGQSGVKEIQEKINSANLTLTKLDSYYKNKTYFSEILEKISQIIPSKLYLSNLSVVASQTKNFSADVSLSGIAPTREDLFDFREALEKDSYFQDIYFPPTNWVKPADINFFVTFKIPTK
jgi:Tfp pilus assembly protein PilN